MNLYLTCGTERSIVQCMLKSMKNFPVAVSMQLSFGIALFHFSYCKLASENTKYEDICRYLFLQGNSPEELLQVWQRT